MTTTNPKIKGFKNGAYTSFEKLVSSEMYLVKCYNKNGKLIDQVRCDDYKEARIMLSAFNKIAKNS